jgi:hypothetical protein
MPKDITLPYILKDVTLMSPGKWNGWEYRSEDLKNAFVNTDWSSPYISSLFLDHPENPHNAASAWVGKVKNPKQLNDGTIKGDLEFWDEDIVYKLTVAKAGFGVSPRVFGDEDKKNQIFLARAFDNFSIVSKPAQDTAILQLSSSIDNVLNFLIVRQLSSEKPKEETKELEKHMMPDTSIDSHSQIKVKKKKVKGGKKEMSKKETSQEVETSEELTEEIEGESESSEELSDADVLSIMNSDLEGFNSYAKEIRVSNPSVSLKELAKKFKVHKERMNFIEELSDTEATSLMQKLLGKMGINEIPKKNIVSDPAVIELAKKLDGLDKSIKELSAKKERVPAPKTAVPQISQPVAKNMFAKNSISEGTIELAKMLRGD